MTDRLLSGINHVALAAADVDVTTRFYEEVFDLPSTDFTVPGAPRSILLFFDSGSFVHVCESDAPLTDAAQEREVIGELIHEGLPLDHFSLFAASEAALEEIRERLVARNATDGEVHDNAITRTVRFVDPDGRRCEVVAYVAAAS